MKNKIFKSFLMLPALILPLMFTSCEKDDDSNPTLDLSHLSDGFVLNTPANAANNTYDLAAANSVELTCTQPNYGTGVPYSTRYYVQVSIDPKFAEGDANAAMSELSTSYTSAKMDVIASEINDSVVALFQKANPDTSVPDDMPIYIRLRAKLNLSSKDLGETYSNVITLPHVKATFVQPDAVFPQQLYVIGSSIQTAWKSWKPVQKAWGVSGQYYTVVYVPANGAFQWGTANNDYRGYSRLTAINDKAGAGVSEGENSNIVFANGGWYLLLFKGTMSSDKKNITYTLDVDPVQAFVTGNACGGFPSDVQLPLTAPADNTGEWVSPAFPASGELRAFVSVPGLDWYRTEFTIYKGECYWRSDDKNDNIVNNWAETKGADYSVGVTAGQKLYVNFDTNKARVE